MWEKLLELIKTVVTLSEDLKQNREEIKELRKDLRDLTAVVTRLAADIEHTKDREASEREKLILQLQNTLLRFEQHVRQNILPPSKD